MILQAILREAVLCVKTDGGSCISLSDRSRASCAVTKPGRSAAAALRADKSRR
jgi:hypothetical protein